jgi:hypothetical protein
MSQVSTIHKMCTRTGTVCAMVTPR